METNRDRCLPDFAAARSDRRRMRCSIGFIALFAGVASLGELPWGWGEARKPVRRPATSRVESQVERSPADVSFVDVAKEAGLGGAVVVGGGVQNKRYILEVMGGGVAFLGTRSNRIGIGARVRTVTGPHAQMEEVISGSSFLSQSDLRLHFGLGQAKTVDLVEVTWPSGAKESFPDVQANQLITIEEGRGIVKAQTFGPLSRSSKPASATQSK